VKDASILYENAQMLLLRRNPNLAIVAANTTAKTTELLKQVFVNSGDFRKLSVQNKINLADRTILIRLALINLIKNAPSDEQIKSYKVALIKPNEFDTYLEDLLHTEEVISN